MMSPNPDLESGETAARPVSRTWMQRLKQEVANAYLARYTNLPAFLDPDWREFLKTKHADSFSDFPMGPAQFAFILQSDEGLSIFRRFDWLSTYCLFDQQQALAKSEADLLALCRERRQHGADHREAEHNALVATIRESLAGYAAIAEAKHSLHQYNDPRANAHHSLLNMVHGNPETVKGIDCSWLFKEGDLMALDSRPQMTHLARLVEGVLTVLPGFIFRKLHMTNSLDRQKFSSVSKFISHDRLMALTLVISTTLALIFILVPVGLLYFFVEEWSKWQRFGIVIGWSVGFLLYLWLGTHAGPHEALGAAASYCALLVVFLGLS